MHDPAIRVWLTLRYLALIPLIALGILSILATSSGGGSDDVATARPAAEEPFSFDEPVGTLTALKLIGVSGTIEVTGTPGATSVSITGVRRVEADTLEDATAQLALLEVVVTRSASELEVRTVEPPASAGRNYIVNYTITLPPDLAVDIASANGPVTVRSLVADCTITGANGRIDADSMTLPPGGTIAMGRANGHVDLEIPQGTSAEFSATVAIGSITLTNLPLSNLTHTDSGTGESWTGTLGTLVPGDGTISLNVAIGTIAVRGL